MSVSTVPTPLSHTIHVRVIEQKPSPPPQVNVVYDPVQTYANNGVGSSGSEGQLDITA